MKTLTCPTCNGTYPDVQKDASPSTHSCPPLSEWEKMKLVLPITNTVERTTGIRDQLQAAITAIGDVNATG